MKPYWQKWKKVAQKITSFQADIIFTILFFLLIVPLSILIKLFSKAALYGYGHENKKEGFWIKRRTALQDLNWARKQ